MNSSEIQLLCVAQTENKICDRGKCIQSSPNTTGKASNVKWEQHIQPMCFRIQTVLIGGLTPQTVTRHDRHWRSSCYFKGLVTYWRTMFETIGSEKVHDFLTIDIYINKIRINVHIDMCINFCCGSPQFDSVSNMYLGFISSTTGLWPGFPAWPVEHQDSSRPTKPGAPVAAGRKHLLGLIEFWLWKSQSLVGHIW